MIALAFAVAGGTNQSHLGVVAWSLVGATAGFLIYNLPPASIFMGDSGSTSIGITLAFMTLGFTQTGSGAAGPLMFSLLVAALPLLDALLAVIRRTCAGKSPLTGDRAHFYDLMRARGWTARKIAFASSAVTALLGGIGWIGLRIYPRTFAILTLLTFGALFAIALRLGSLRADPEPADSTCIAPAVTAVTTVVPLGASRPLS